MTQITIFLGLTFGISLAGFACIWAIPSARSPETLTGLPFWIVMVWGPSLAAIIIALRHGQLPELLGRIVQFAQVPLPVWGIVIAPLVILLILRPFVPDDPMPLGLGMGLAMVGFNLILGPLGEELGWRGVLQDQLHPKVGWLGASLMVGAIWTVWHLPLWTIESPHAQIRLPLFAAHCMVYAVTIGAAHALSGGSLMPAILLHLTFNLASNYAVFAGYRDPNAWFSASLLPYIALAVGASALVALIR
ncbi:CPBP family intramembrane glutamic endopeptidase [Marivivens marinus]|uniref:CPBP family intramembrane glutamic endopeptidase n=1 Tax=Marivivens marinus TaxID=3110173 RepID=UPI003B849738